VQRNPIIAEVFYRAGRIEKWGRGTNHVAEMCRAVGITPPDFREIAGAVVVTFRVAVAADRGELAVQAQWIVDHLGRRPRKDRLRAAILALADLRAWRPIELAAALGISPRGLVERHLSPMVEEGLLVRSHPDSPTHPAQAYRARPPKGHP
jgi:ATP-dependent DNA helicase RecG